MRLRALTWLRRQKRRGRRQEKRYLPHRITQEKHQLSRVMLTPGVGARGAGVGGGPAVLCRGVGWRARRQARALPRGVPDPQPRSSSRSVLPPLAGGELQGPRGAAPTCLHLPGSPCRRRGRTPGLPPLPPLSSPPRDSLWTASVPGGLGGGHRHPGNFGGLGNRTGEATGTRQRRCPAPGAHLLGRRSSAAIPAAVAGGALCFQLQ